MHRIFYFVLVILVTSVWNQIRVSALGSIPNADLRLELLLATGSLDTSGLLRTVTSTGGIPTYGVDPIYGMKYAKFSGNGGLQVTTGWAGTSTDDFTVSLWVKVSQSDLPPTIGNVLPPTMVPPYGYLGSVTTQYLSTIFSTQTTPTINSLNLRLRSDFKCSLGGINSPSPQLFYLDALNNPTFFVDCSALKDGKWHIIVMKRFNKVLNIRIDATEIYNSVSDLSIGRTISLGRYQFGANTGAIAYSMGQDYKLTNSYSHYKGGIAGFRLYSRALSNEEILGITEEFLSAQSELVGVGNIILGLESYMRPNLNFTLKSIPLNLNKSSVQYQYSYGSGIFFPIDSKLIQDISTSTGTLSYRFNLDISSIPDGSITITLRVKSGTSYQNIGTIKFTKNDITYLITINQPDTLPSLSKSISAIAGGGVLSFSLTRGNICDSTLLFESYTELLFTSKTDNSIRVCYKAFYPTVNKTIFKLSDPIQGINTISNTTLTAKIFDDYLSWTKSIYPRFNDSATLILDLLGVNSTSSNGTINGVTMTDINGDGLVDFLYSRNDPIRRAIIVNNGNYTFRTVYKCAIDGTSYYGDCADLYR